MAVPEVRSYQSGYVLKIKSTDLLIEWTEGVKEREDQSRHQSFWPKSLKDGVVIH